MLEQPAGQDKRITIDIVLGELGDQIIRARKLVYGETPTAEAKNPTPQPASKTLRYVDAIKQMTDDLREVNRQLESL